MNFKNLLAITAASSLLLACAPAKPRYFDLQPKEKVAIGALVSNGYITKEGLERIKPGLLQNKVEFYKYPQLAVDSTAQLLIPKIAAALPDVELLTIADLESNSAYQEASRPSEQNILGMTQTEGDGDVFAKSLGYVSAMGAQQKVDAMMTALGVDAMITIHCDANLEVAMVGNDNVKVEASVGPVTWLVIRNKPMVSLYRKGKGLVWSERFDLVGTEKATAIGYLVGDEHLPRLFASSLEGLPAALAQALDKFRNRPVEPAK